MNAERRTIRRIAVGLAVAATLATSACAAGQQSETAQEKTTLDGTNADIGKIALRGLAVVTPDAATYAVGSNPQLRLVVVNDGSAADKLTKISTSASTGWGTFRNQAAYEAATSLVPAEPATSSPTDGSATASTSVAGPTTPITIASGVAASFGVPAANGKILALLATKKVIYPGSTISITFTFAKAGTKTVVVPVQLSDTGSYTPSPSYLPSTDADGEG